MSNDFNPYSSPMYSSASPFPGAKQAYLADLGKRFLGALIDGLAGIVILPGYILLGASMPENPNQNTDISALGIIGLLWILVSGLALMGAQLYLLYTRSQSIGKYFVKTQIVDANTGVRATFVSCFLLRSLVHGILTAIPCLGGIYALVDICFIFRDDRRCIHDLIANTQVVDIS